MSSPTSAGSGGISPFSSVNQNTTSISSSSSSSIIGGGGSRQSRGEGPRTHLHAPLEPEVVSKLDGLFFKFLQKICSDLRACDSRGDQIHQPLMAKKMQRLDASTNFRPFKFRIQAFTNAFQESLIEYGLTEDILPLRKIKVYLWKHKYISRFNEDGKKQKSKGNHVWNIEARRLDPLITASSSSSSTLSTLAIRGVAGSSSSTATVTTGFDKSQGPHSDPPVRWEFREYTSRIAGQIIKFARVGVPYVYAPRVWDAQMACPEATYSSPWLPAWLKWHRGELRGTPGPDDKSCSITVIAEYKRENEKCQLELTFQLTVSDPEKEGELMDSPNELEDEREEEEEEDRGGGDSSDEEGFEDETEFENRGRNRKEGREAKERQDSKRRKQTR
ncbi:hypothetical protein BGZ76_003094 [Entomortierella beljakovae]|nr:hypothetical protein BGZ76_003094 [Entomortierella beljakovae]